MWILNRELDRYPGVKADQDYAVRQVIQNFVNSKDKLSADTRIAIKSATDSLAKINILANADQVGDVVEDEGELLRSGRPIPNDDDNHNWKFPRHSLYSVSSEELSKMGN